MVANVWSKVLDYTLKRTGLKKKEFAEAADISVKSLSRYATGQHGVGSNFDSIAKGAKLTPGQLGYVYASFVMEHYRPYRFDLGPHFESEIREPPATYDPPTARERAETLVRHDMLQVPAHLAAPLSLLRQQIQEVLKDQDAADKKREAQLLRLVELCEETFEGAVDTWKEMQSLRGE